MSDRKIKAQNDYLSKDCFPFEEVKNQIKAGAFGYFTQIKSVNTSVEHGKRRVIFLLTNNTRSEFKKVNLLASIAKVPGASPDERVEKIFINKLSFKHYTDEFAEDLRLKNLLKASLDDPEESTPDYVSEA